jgi:hypothetical protein
MGRLVLVGALAGTSCVDVSSSGGPPRPLSPGTSPHTAAKPTSTAPRPPSSRLPPTPAGASYVLETKEHSFDAGAAIDWARAGGTEPRLVLFGAPPETLNRPPPPGVREALAREASRRDPVVVLALPRGSGLAVDGQGGFIRDADLALVEAAVTSLRARGLDARFDRRSTLGLGVRGLGARPSWRVLLDLDRIRLRRSGKDTEGVITSAATARLTVRDSSGHDREVRVVSLSARRDRPPFDVLGALGQALATEVTVAIEQVAAGGGIEKRGQAEGPLAPTPVFWEPLPRSLDAGTTDGPTLRPGDVFVEVPPLSPAVPLRLAMAPGARWLSPRSPLGVALDEVLRRARLGRATAPSARPGEDRAPELRVEPTFWRVPSGDAGKGSVVTSVNLTYQMTDGGERWAEGSVHAASLDPREAIAKATARLIVTCEHELGRHGDGDGTDSAHPGAASSAPPSVFVLERVAHTRDVLETVFVETRTGALLRREVGPLADAAHGPPGQWLLSERTAEGLLLSPSAYTRLATNLASQVAVGPIGDGFHLGYFGKFPDE